MLCIACEGIVRGEQVDMYNFVASFLAECVLGCLLSLVNIVASDEFFE